MWVVPACTTAVLVGMHMLPGSDLDTDTWWMTWHMDKVLHMIAFSGCALTWAIALAKQRRLQGDWRLEQVLVGGALVFGMVLEATLAARFFDLRMAAVAMGSLLIGGIDAFFILLTRLGK